jgi:hypothetical protein
MGTLWRACNQTSTWQAKDILDEARRLKPGPERKELRQTAKVLLEIAKLEAASESALDPRLAAEKLTGRRIGLFQLFTPIGVVPGECRRGGSLLNNRWIDFLQPIDRPRLRPSCIRWRNHALGGAPRFHSKIPVDRTSCSMLSGPIAPKSTGPPTICASSGFHARSQSAT